MSEASVFTPPRVTTGIGGLDRILQGGLPRHRVYLVQGDPGTGKTTLALQFLLEGTRRAETGLYVTLSETRDELQDVAASHGWSLDPLALYELTPSEEDLKPEKQYTLFHPGEVELHEATRTVFDEVERVRPARVVFDSLVEMRLLAREPLRYRRQILALKQFFLGRQCTVLLLDDQTSDGDLQLQTMAHGVICLEQLTPAYGRERRRLQVVKLRGVPYRGGYHDFTIETGGLAVYPRLAATPRATAPPPQPVGSGVPELDALLGGGLQAGTTALLVGPTGVGKSVLTAHYVQAAAERGERAAIYVFDEAVETYLARADGLGINLRRHHRAGLVALEQMDAAEVSPGEFAHRACLAVEHDRARVVVIDSLNGYMTSMADDPSLLTRLHELFSFLRRQGVLTVTVLAQQGLLGASLESPLDVSYLADTVLLLRYFESAGAVRQALSVIKKRVGPHERGIHEFVLGPRGVSIGRPLQEFQGVLTGVPVQRLGGQPRQGGTHGRT
jgi:circadian clock protein KaiC